MDAPRAWGLDFAPNEEGRSRRLEIIAQLGKMLTEGQGVVERDQSQEAGASTDAKTCLPKLATVEMVSPAPEETLSEVENTTFNAETRMSTTQRSLMCPIHRLPPEALSAIFQNSLCKGTNIARMRTTLFLASVCRYWRAVTCSFGALWSHIAFSPKYKKGAAIFVARSCRALDLTVNEDCLDWASSNLITPTGGPLITPDRVRYLFIVAKHDSDKDIISSWAVVLPNLSYFQIKANRQNCIRTISGDFLSLFPNLEDLELARVNLQFSKDFELMKLQRVSWFLDHDPTQPQCVLGDIWSRAPHLKSFIFDGPLPSGRTKFTSRVFGPLTELNAMEIDFLDLLIIEPLTDPLIIPHLQHLTVSWIPLSRSREKRLNDIFLHYASLASLTRLTLIFDTLENSSKLEDFKYQLDCLVHLAHLTRLDIAGVNAADYHEEHPSVAYLCHLLSLCTSKPWFPSLRTIHFIGKIKNGVCLDSVIRMARARTAAAVLSPNEVAKLESIVFEDFEPLTVEQHRQLLDALGQNND